MLSHLRGTSALQLSWLVRLHYRSDVHPELANLNERLHYFLGNYVTHIHVGIDISAMLCMSPCSSDYIISQLFGTSAYSLYGECNFMMISEKGVSGATHP